MALGFGRKKANDAQQTPASPSNDADDMNVTGDGEPSPDDLSAFDLDAFANQLEAGGGTGGASRFDDIFSAPASTSPAPAPAVSTSAFDFPEAPADEEDILGDFSSSPNVPQQPSPAVAPVSLVPSTPLAASDPLDLNQMYVAEQQQAIASGKIEPPSSISPTDINTGLAEGDVEERPKKKLPLVPIIAGVVVLGIAGGAAMFLTGNNEEEEVAPPPMPRRAARPVEPPVAPANPASPAQAAAPIKPAAPAKPASPAKPVAASPVVKPGMSPSMSAQMAKMKALWKQGADAKHRGDKVAAVRYWRQGLVIQPNNQGFKDAIAKVNIKNQ